MDTALLALARDSRKASAFARVRPITIALRL